MVLALCLSSLAFFNYLKLRRTGRNRSGQDEQAAAGRHTVGERLRLSCEELGPTFVKIGQISKHSS
jgi:ubiquinone biosynthesis protein